MKRVVITGIGAVTPLAVGFSKSWESVKQGHSGIERIGELSGSMKWKAAGSIKNLRNDCFMTKKELKFSDPFMVYAVAAAMEAADNAGFSAENKKNLTNAGVIIGSSRGGISTLERSIMKMASGMTDSHLRISPFVMPASTVSAAASQVAMKIGINGYCLGISNACASGTNAIGEAFRLIRNGHQQIILAGGSEAPLCPTCIEGYGAAGALSKAAPENASRPFDVLRDGFVLAEGACVLVLEELESARLRKAQVIGEIIGYGNMCDASHITKPSGDGEVRAITAALDDAQVYASDIDYVNAHGTSTPVGDRVEAEAIKKIFGSVPVSSVKSMTGHMLAASGPFEAACTAMSIKEGFITPTINTSNIDPACEINLITQPAEASLDVALTSSFGFGGVNAILVLRKYA